ncbi:transposase [Caballeronia concitans]|uniref:Transposase n=1 Tax=Caballeronia concitans TaxID=1777133 RepID=A0A658R0U4_9BURK|nr:transposase [Caballeronia concitans]
MVRSAKQVYRLTGRAAMYSPGAPSLGHEVERRFWQQIATGITSEKAAQAVGASQAVGSRWFRYRGSMPLFMSKPIAGRYLSFAEREEIALLSVQGFGVREIARRIGRNASTVSRELTRNAATRGGCLEYRASVAQWKAERFAKRPKPAKLATNVELRQYVRERLEGKVHDADGRKIDGPKQTPFKGRNKPHRGDRKWVNGWSPEQIANRLQVDFPDDESILDICRFCHPWPVSTVLFDFGSYAEGSLSVSWPKRLVFTTAPRNVYLFRPNTAITSVLS